MAVGGLDIGTSGCTFVAFHADGSILCEAKRGYREYGTRGIREIRPEEVWNAVVEVLQEITLICRENIEGFAVTSLGESLVLCDEVGDVLCNAMVTGDKRGIEESQKLEKQLGKEKIMELTGVPVSEMYTLPKLMWLSHHLDNFHRVKSIFLFEDYICYRLTGEKAVSYSSASRTMAFDIKQKQWCQMLLDYAGVDVSLLSKPLASGTLIGNIKKEISDLTGLRRETVLVTGGHDQMCAALGCGVVGQEICGDGMGTCEALTAVIHPETNRGAMMADEMPCVPYIGQESYLTYLVMTNCGILMNWYRDTFFPSAFMLAGELERNRFDIMDAEISDRPSGLLVIPNFGSAGNPDVDYDAKGMVWGLTIHTQRNELFRAFKEGMAFHMKYCMESLEKIRSSPKKIHAVGGGTNSDITLQIKADIYNLPVCRLQNKEAGALGCMILTSTALGTYKSLEDAVRQVVSVKETFYPNEKHASEYKELFEKYKNLYIQMHNFK